jgi:hypothetical protein
VSMGWTTAFPPASTDFATVLSTSSE